MAVFGAGNFPLAISVAGTDTVAAFAARCPVVVKGHPAHPGTCELVARIIAEAVAWAELPPGMFSMLQSSGYGAGLALVKHPLTAAVAFTGSLRGGRALFDAAAARPEPIPVYAEMGSVNPVFILPGAATARAEEIAEGFVRSLNTGVGQFCTNPGMALAVDGPAFDKFLAAVCVNASRVPPAAMLHAGIQKAYDSGTERLSSIPGVELVCAAAAPRLGDTLPQGVPMAVCKIFTADAGLFLRRPELSEEVFGPATIIYRCKNTAQLLAVARGMSGPTATIHGTEKELLGRASLWVLERRQAHSFQRVPTGWSPAPACTTGPIRDHAQLYQRWDGGHLQVRAAGLFPEFPDAALPGELREANPRKVRRLTDGALEKKRYV